MEIQTSDMFVSILFLNQEHGLADFSSDEFRNERDLETYVLAAPLISAI